MCVEELVRAGMSITSPMRTSELSTLPFGRPWLMTDESPAERAVAGVEAAQEEFVREHYPRLVGSLSLLVGDSTWAEELAHESFIRAFTKFSSLTEINYPAAWLFRVGSNLAKSAWRRKQAERRANLRLGLPAESHTDPDPGDVLAVREALQALPKRQRAVLICRYFSGLTVSETATALDVAEGTVKSLTHQAIRSMRAELDIDLASSMDPAVDLRGQVVSHE